MKKQLEDKVIIEKSLLTQIELLKKKMFEDDVIVQKRSKECVYNLAQIQRLVDALLLKATSIKSPIEVKNDLLRIEHFSDKIFAAFQMSNENIGEMMSEIEAVEQFKDKLEGIEKLLSSLALDSLR